MDSGDGIFPMILPFQRMVNGDVEKMIGSFIDITERKQAEEEKGGILEVSVNDTKIDKMSMIPNLRPGEYIEIKVSDTGMGILLCDNYLVRLTTINLSGYS